MTDSPKADSSAPGAPSDALTAILDKAAEGIRHPPAEPAADPRVAAAFALGWQMAELYRPDPPTPKVAAAHDDLPGLGRLGVDERSEIALQQVDAALAKLSDTLTAAKVKLPDTKPMGECLRASPVDPTARTRSVRALHVDMLAALTAADFRLGKAYNLGRALADTCRNPASGTTLNAEFHPHRVAKLREWLDDLASALPAHAGRSVEISLGKWEARLGESPQKGAQNRASEALPALRRQGQLWRALLSAEKAGTDMLAVRDYLNAASSLFRTSGKVIGRFMLRFSWAVLLALALFAGGIYMIVHFESSASIVAGAGSILASIGLSWKSIGAVIGGFAAAAEQHLWGAELDNAIAEAITLLPETSTRRQRVARRAKRVISGDSTSTHRLALAEKAPEQASAPILKPQLLDPVLDPDQLQDMLAKIKKSRPGGVSANVPDEQRLPIDHFDKLSEEIAEEQEGPQRAIRAATPAPSSVPAPPPVIYLSRKPKVSQFMSVISDCFESQLAGPALEASLHLGALDLLWRDLERWTEDLRSRFRKFGPCDIAYLEPKLYQALSGLRGKHPFSSNPPQVELGEQAKVFVLGDWATGLPQARNVASRIREQLVQIPAGTDCHVIHLGDTYYSGLEDECRRRFLDQWPVPPGSGDRSWTLAGNHDMYSGGYGFFKVLLADPRFDVQGRCSYFALANDHWQILGLDSSYKNPDKASLEQPQAEWLSDRVQGADGRGTIMMTHHQPFSAYEQVETPLAQEVAGALGGAQLEAWLWGHEHRCTVYRPGIATEAYAQLARYTAIIGHGGVPTLRSGGDEPAQADVSEDAIGWELADYYEVGDNHWGLGGFAVMTFDGPRAEIQYYDEYGKERRHGPPFAYTSELAGVAQALAAKDERPIYPPDVLRAGEGPAEPSVEGPKPAEPSVEAPKPAESS